MGDRKRQISEKIQAFNKGLSELLDVLNDIASGNDGEQSFIDNDGNKIKLGIELLDNKGILNLDIEQKDSNLYLSLVEPVSEQTLRELKGKGLTNVFCEKK